MQIPDTMNDDLMNILGMANFQAGPIAHAMQAAGADIPRRSEAEQAHVIHKLLSAQADGGDVDGAPDWTSRRDDPLRHTALSAERAIRGVRRSGLRLWEPDARLHSV